MRLFTALYVLAIPFLAIGDGLWWENWNVGKSLVMVGGIGGFFIFLILLFNGTITKKFKWMPGMWIVIAIILASFVGISIWIFGSPW